VSERGICCVHESLVMKLRHLRTDRNCNGVSDPGEVVRIQRFWIEVIRCSGQMSNDGMSWNPSGVEFEDGRTRPTYDWIAPTTPTSPEVDHVR
jgi:hypothetical protein